MIHPPYLMSTRNNLFYDSLEPGQVPYVWDGDQQKWKKISVTSEELLEAEPVTDEEAHLFMEVGRVPEAKRPPHMKTRQSVMKKEKP